MTATTTTTTLQLKFCLHLSDMSNNKHKIGEGLPHYYWIQRVATIYRSTDVSNCCNFLYLKFETAGEGSETKLIETIYNVICFTCWTR